MADKDEIVTVPSNVDISTCTCGDAEDDHVDALDPDRYENDGARPCLVDDCDCENFEVGFGEVADGPEEGPVAPCELCGLVLGYCICTTEELDSLP